MIYDSHAPAADEIEVILFGPGYGEAVAVHIGDGKWMLVDSCIDPATRAPASSTYLDHIGVQSDQVVAIVASHWHDDHVRGISLLADKYPAADFVISAVFGEREASTLLSAFSGGATNGLNRGTRELFSVTKKRAVACAQQRTIILQMTAAERNVLVTALSPVSAALLQSVAHLAQFLPAPGDGINNAPPETSPNIQSVVLHVDLGDDAILLGADLENHAACGWEAVVTGSWSGSRRPATVYKVPHHGSHTGHYSPIWNKLLTPSSVACLTPFTLGNQRLPTEEDRARLKETGNPVYVSSGASQRPQIENRQLKRLADVCKNLRAVGAGFGAVRLRKPKLAKEWRVDLFGAAQPL